MKKHKKTYGMILGVLGLISMTHAVTAPYPHPQFQVSSAPGFIISPTPGSPTTININAGQQASTSYSIKKNQLNTSSLGYGLFLPKGIVQIGGSCSKPLFYLAAGASCTVELQITADDLAGDVTGGGPKVCPGGKAGTRCTRPSLANQLKVVKDKGASSSLTAAATSIIPVGGGSGTLVVTNTGNSTVHNVHAVLPSAWSGVTQDASNCSSIAPISSAPNNTCTLSFSSSSPYVAQENIAITGDHISNAPTTALAFRYQGGLVFSITGSTVKVVSETDNSLLFVWDANPNCLPPYFSCTNTGAWDLFHGENLPTVSGSTNPSDTGSNGPGNTYLISSTLSGTGGNTNIPATYAAGVCISYNGASYPDWYLPSICELGTYDPEKGGLDAECEDSTPNIASNLYRLGFLSDLSELGNYWSSTEGATPSDPYVFSQAFDPDQTSTQYAYPKYAAFGVRCIRITN